MDRMKAHVEKFNTKIIMDHIEDVKLDVHPLY